MLHQNLSASIKWKAAHSGIAGNECADAIAKHSALHDGGHDVHFQPPALDGNANTHLNWLPAKDTDEDPSRRGAIAPRLRALSDLKAKLNNRNVQITQTLGSAKADAGYYNYWKDLRPLVNKQAIHAFWNKSNLKFYEKRNVMGYRTGTILMKYTPTGTASLPMQTGHLPLHW
jgi:hypothetical protein